MKEPSFYDIFKKKDDTDVHTDTRHDTQSS